jgi:cell division protein FtsA
MAIPPIAGLEIGTSRTVVCVGETDEATKRVRVKALGVYPTIGVRKGQIVDLSQAKGCVEAAIKLAEKNSNIAIWQVILACSGGHIRTVTNKGVLSIRSADHCVTAEDIEEINEIARDIQTTPDMQVLHTLPKFYRVDDQEGVTNPLGMSCKVLTLDMLAITGSKNRIENFANVARNVETDVTDVVFSGLCVALSVLTPEQRKSGTVVIDLGGGTTNYVAYDGDGISAAGCVAVGGDHITNDIALAFNIAINKAEDLKRAEGCAVIDSAASQGRITLKQDVGFEERNISRKALHTVINARLDETFRIIRSRLDNDEVLPHIGGGILLTGGGAYLRNATELAEHIFGVPCRIGTPINVDGLDGVEQPASLATAAGLLIYGQKTYEGSDSFSVKSFLKGLFGK